MRGEVCPMRPELVLEGVIPANLMAFDSALEIDEENYRRHLRYLVDTPGVAGITTNAHASEVATLTFEEQQRVLEVTLAEVAEAVSLPIIVFVYPVASGLHIPTDSLVKICDEIDNVIAVKEWSNDIGVYERNWRELKALDKEVSLLSSFSKSLLASLCIGADGILSGHGSVIADLHVEMFEAVNRGDLDGARSVAARAYPVVQATYAEPFLDGHNRMKEALAILGRIDEAHVRPPLRRISDAEREEIRRVVTEAGLPGALREQPDAALGRRG